MSANSSPNLFRLSLPEWLKEQVDCGQHKGVYWINEKERIFHVPWKHASRNGWEDGDVSLFKAWAIYTNRYRIGIDKPRPALWKTNFRCAINSHNSISFLKDQGQRKGDKAHRIMRLIDPPKKSRRLMNSPDSPTEPPRKLVRLTYPNFGPPPDSKSHRKSSSSHHHNGHNRIRGIEFCEGCNDVKGRLHFILENAFNGQENIENNQEYLNLKSKYVECITSKEHICIDKGINDLVESMSPSKPFTPSQDMKPKPNLQDLYFIGKALQSGDDLSTLNVQVKTEGPINIAEMTSRVKKLKDPHRAINTKNIKVKQERRETDDDEESGSDNEDSFFANKDIENVEISEEEDDLITPRDT